MTDEYKFISTDSEAITAELVSEYERITGRTLNPADPDRVFISWVASVIMQDRIHINYAANQNIPSRATGENLDTLGKWIFGLSRRSAQPAKCTVRFCIAEAQESAITIATGTRVSDTSQTLVWATTEEAIIPIGSTSVDVMVLCQTAGTVGNGYAAGQINTLIDVDNILYFDSCANTTESDGGAEEQNDESYYASMRAVLDSYSTAGAIGAYEYYAKSVSDEIADVKVIRPKEKIEKTLDIYTLDNGIYAFVGGEQLDINTLIVKTAEDGDTATITTDYTVAYDDGLLTITLDDNGILSGAETIYISVEKDYGGRVNIYALMDDGTLPTETIKSAIAAACNDDNVRPLTDYVTVHDPATVSYNISLKYYIADNAQKSVSDISAAVNDTVQDYVAWQCGKLGRDINPSKLQTMLMETGIKRVEIAAPTFTRLRSEPPQIAAVGTITVTNGGVEDE